MDPLLIIDGVAVGVTAMLAYITAIAKKMLKARLGRLEKARDVLFQRYILAHRHLKAIDGTRKLYSGWIVEKRKKLEELTLELQEWESKEEGEEGEIEGEEEDEAAAETDDGSEGGAGREPQEATEDNRPVEASDHSEKPDADPDEDEGTEENPAEGSVGDSEKPAAGPEELAGKDGKKDIKVNFRDQQRVIDFGRNR